MLYVTMENKMSEIPFLLYANYLTAEANIDTGHIKDNYVIRDMISSVV